MSEEHFLLFDDVHKQTSLPHSTLYAMMKRGEFPRPMKIGRKRVAWPASEVKTWMQNRERTAGGYR